MERYLLTSLLFSASCFVFTGNECGNGVTNVGEACDDANTQSGDGCNNTCTKVERCGDGVIDASEVCDDGNRVSGDGCSDDCNRLEACGDGVADPGEVCDDGNKFDDDGCSSVCLFESCGDGVVDLGEACDDQNLVSGDGCDENCTITSCGNDLITVGEQCDDGNTTDNDGCDSNCTTSRCGNQIVNIDEECDDGNIVSGDGCRSDCSQEVCGDGIVDRLELCDDGNNINNDACPNSCGVDPSDNDGDSFTEAQGDCNDDNAAVSPGSFEILGDNLDNNCDAQIDVVVPCDTNLDTSAQSFAKAIGLCNGEVESASFFGPSAPQARSIVTSFGANNVPFEGASWVHFSTGNANTLDHNQGTNLFNTFNSPVANLPRGCGAPSASLVNDYTELELKLRVPNNAHSFSLAFQFLSSEYPVFRCTQFSDTFAALLSSTPFTGNITVDLLGNGISLDSSFFQVCLDSASPTPPKDCSVDPTQTLQGTGYDLSFNEGGASLPMLTTAPVNPGELITLRLIIFDEGDGLFDSSVLLDAFTWHTEAIAQPNIGPF
jgi:cysteine-rich repeat protein